MCRMPPAAAGTAIPMTTAPAVMTTITAMNTNIAPTITLTITDTSTAAMTMTTIMGTSTAAMTTTTIMSSVAAIAGYQSPIVMIDMGTATSLSLIQGSVYEGCIIMPGLTLALRAMSEQAAALPPISIESPAQVDLLGHTTEEAMRSGVLYGHASMVDGMLDRIEERVGQPVTVVATGGNAPKILRYCRHEIRYDADLVIRGLYLLYQKNTRKPRKA